MRNVKNFSLCVLMLTLVSTAAAMTTFVQYDFENIAPDQGVGVPAPPSYVDSALVNASDLGIVQGSGVYLLDTLYRDGVVDPGPTQQMSFQQGIPAYTHIAPELYNSFEFSVAAVLNPLDITSISFSTGHNDTPDQSLHDGIIEYRSSAGVLLGSDTFEIPYGFELAPVSIVPSLSLLVETEPIFFNIRFNEEIYGMNSYTTQLRIDDVELSGSVIPAPGALLLGCIGVSFVGWLRRRKTL